MTVIIQSYQPDSPLLNTLIHEGYGAFALQELASRAAAELPPNTPMALLQSRSGGWRGCPPLADCARRRTLGPGLQVFGSGARAHAASG